MNLRSLQIFEAKEKYRGVFEIQRSGDKTSSGEIGLDIRTHASPKVGQDQVSGGVSVPCRHATLVADAPKYLQMNYRYLKLNSRYLQINFRYLQMNLIYLKLN